MPKQLPANDRAPWGTRVLPLRPYSGLLNKKSWHCTLSCLGETFSELYCSLSPLLPIFFSQVSDLTQETLPAYICLLPSWASYSRNTWKVLSWHLFLRGPGTSLMAQMVKNLPAVQEIWVWSLGWEDPLEKGKATHSSIMAWKIPWTEESGGLESTGSQRVS